MYETNCFIPFNEHSKVLQKNIKVTELIIHYVNLIFKKKIEKMMIILYFVHSFTIIEEKKCIKHKNLNF